MNWIVGYKLIEEFCIFVVNFCIENCFLNFFDFFVTFYDCVSNF
jgi:hypothetical protein